MRESKRHNKKLKRKNSHSHIFDTNRPMHQVGVTSSTFGGGEIAKGIVPVSHSCILSGSNILSNLACEYLEMLFLGPVYEGSL